MNILVLSDIETAGEWLATQNMLSLLKKKDKNLNLYLVVYGKNTLHLHKELFLTILLVDKSPLTPPFKYYRQIFLEFISGKKAIGQTINHANKIDRIIATNYSLFLPAKFLLPAVKSVFWFHGVKNAIDIKFNFYEFLIKSSERLAWLLSDKFIVPSEWAKKLVEKELHVFSKFKKIFVIPNMVSHVFFHKFSVLEKQEFKKKLGIPVNEKTVLYAGRIDPVKGIDNLIKAVILLRINKINIKLIIAYPDYYVNKDYLNSMEKLIIEKKIKSNVYFFKDLLGINIAKLYQVCDCAVLPSLREMNSLFLLESLASGLPIFSTPVGNAKKLLEKIDPFFILKNNSPLIICAALKKFFKQNPSWHNGVESNIKNVVKKDIKISKPVTDFENLLR